MTGQAGANMKSIKWRDRYIMAKALAYAIEAIYELPPGRSKYRDRKDMVRLLGALTKSDEELASLLWDAQAVLTGDWHLKLPQGVGYSIVGKQTGGPLDLPSGVDVEIKA